MLQVSVGAVFHPISATRTRKATFTLFENRLVLLMRPDSPLMRLPEPELMDTAEQVYAYSTADFSAAHQGFVDACLQRFPTLSPTRLLDSGCGPADVTTRFAHAYPDSHIDAFDAGQNMLTAARSRIKALELDQRVHLLHAQLPEFPALPSRHYDMIISNSVLHHLADPMDLWRCIKHFAAPGAAVAVMDLRRPRNASTLGKLVHHYCTAAPDILTKDFSASLRAAYTEKEIKAQLSAMDWAFLNIECLGDRHILISGHFDKPKG